MSTSILFADIPEEIRACRIGSCMNSLTRLLNPYVITFDPQKLSGANLLRFVNGKGELICQANSSSSEFAANSVFALDTKIEGGYFGCTASAGFNMALASKSVSQNQGINCFVSYIYEGQKIQLLYQGVSPKTLYNCMGADFQNLYDDVMNAETNQEYLEKYNNFINTYGHGCITALYLTAGSVFMININYSNAAEADSSKYGGTVAVNTPFGGGAVASDWGKEIASASSNVTMSLVGEDIPEGTPTTGWCRDMVGKFHDQAVSILCEKTSVISAPATDGPEAPEPPEKKDPDNKEVPSRQNVDPNLTKELQDEIMKEDGFVDWDEYIKAQKEAYEKLSPNNIVADALKNLTSTELQSTPDFSAGALMASNAVNDVWDLGGYVPYAYEITPWSVLFPDLQFQLPHSFTSIYFGKMYTYYLTRLQFAQYLYFLSDLGPDICANDGINIDAAIYFEHCQDLLQSITSLKKIDNDIYCGQVSNFERLISTDSKFHSKSVYEKFYKIYDILSGSPYGFIEVHDKNPDNSSSYFASPGIAKRLPEPFSISAMLVDAMRWYPVIRNEGEVVLAMFDGNQWQEINTFVEYMPIKTDDKGNKFLSIDDNRCYYYVSFADVPKSASQLLIRGLPMFIDLPFDDVKEFAKPPS